MEEPLALFFCVFIKDGHILGAYFLGLYANNVFLKVRRDEAGSRAFD
jgi:hypothetical protein